MPKLHKLLWNPVQIWLPFHKILYHLHPEAGNPGIMAYCTFYDTFPCLILTLDFDAVNAGFLHCKHLFALFYTLYDTIIILSFSTTYRLPAKNRLNEPPRNAIKKSCKGTTP